MKLKRKLLIKNNSLFGNVKITKNANPDKYSYSRYRIGFDSRSHFSNPNFDWGENVIIFGADMSSSAHNANRKNGKKKRKNILILGKGPTQGLDDTTLTVEAEYSI